MRIEICFSLGTHWNVSRYKSGVWVETMSTVIVVMTTMYRICVGCVNWNLWSIGEETICNTHIRQWMCELKYARRFWWWISSLIGDVNWNLWSLIQRDGSFTFYFLSHPFGDVWIETNDFPKQVADCIFAPAKRCVSWNRILYAITFNGTPNKEIVEKTAPKPLRWKIGH